MSYSKHLEKNLKRDESYWETGKHTNKPVFFYEYDLMYDDLSNKYLSYIKELEFSRKYNYLSRIKNLIGKINKMNNKYPEMVLSL